MRRPKHQYEVEVKPNGAWQVECGTDLGGNYRYAEVIASGKAADMNEAERQARVAVAEHQAKRAQRARDERATRRFVI